MTRYQQKFTDGNIRKIAFRSRVDHPRFEKADAERGLLGSIISKKLRFFGHVIREPGTCLEKETVEGTTPGARVRGRPHTTWQDNIKTWTGLSLVEAVRVMEDRSHWRKIIHDAAEPLSVANG